MGKDDDGKVAGSSPCQLIRNSPREPKLGKRGQ
jgi:hypothetical protein